jgi:hypothetical protein
MPLFNSPKSENYPRKWSEMSLDFKLMFVWHGSMMFLMITGGNFTSGQELTFAAILMAVLFSVSIQHRRSKGWQWQPVESKQFAWAAGSLLLTALFLYASSPLFSPLNPGFLPWYLAGFGIGIMNVLSAIGLVRLSESQFIADCQTTAPQAPALAPTAEPADPAWQRFLRGSFQLAFLGIWLNFMVFFYLHGKAIRNGSPTPTAAQTDSVTEHGGTVYVTHKEKVLDDRLLTISMIGIPSAMAAAAILHFLLGVKLFPNAPTLKEYLNRKT